MLPEWLSFRKEIRSRAVKFIDTFSFKLKEQLFTFHKQYKHPGTFANRKYEELSYPQKSGNVRPHSSNSVENVAPL